MAIGRIRRRRYKIKASREKQSGKVIRHRATINVEVSRSRAGRYMAQACIGIGKKPVDMPKFYTAQEKRKAKIHMNRCELGSGRTPQSAIAKSVRNLSVLIAKRGKKWRG